MCAPVFYPVPCRPPSQPHRAMPHTKPMDPVLYVQRWNLKKKTPWQFKIPSYVSEIYLFTSRGTWRLNVSFATIKNKSAVVQDDFWFSLLRPNTVSFYTTRDFVMPLMLRVISFLKRTKRRRKHLFSNRVNVFFHL